MTFSDTPIDAAAAERLSERGLHLGLVDTSDTVAFTAWLQADARGFYGPKTAQREIDEQLNGTAYRRTTGVWDETAADAATPVATVSSWPTPLTVPGGGTVSSWAISSVTVAPTHRRRGIARALLESELRTAASLRIPLAVLTVSESTIYGRYGFAPAAMAAELTIDTRRARFTGPEASGRLHFVSLEQLREQGREVMERVRLQVPGEIQLDDHLWDRLVGTAGDPKKESPQRRVVRYDDADGIAQGFVVYRVTEGEPDFTQHTVVVEYLLAATDEAYAALWRYLLEMDLVSTVSAPLRSVDEPLLWQVSDVRAVRRVPTDHLWARILDVPAALSARSYGAPGRIALDVSDPLGLAAGRFLLEIDAHGVAEVTPLAGDADLPADAAGLALTVNELAALYLGGTSAHTLLRAGRLTEFTSGAADAVAASFRSAAAPWLSTWF